MQLSCMIDIIVSQLFVFAKQNSNDGLIWLQCEWTKLKLMEFERQIVKLLLIMF